MHIIANDGKHAMVSVQGMTVIITECETKSTVQVLSLTENSETMQFALKPGKFEDTVEIVYDEELKSKE